MNEPPRFVILGMKESVNKFMNDIGRIQYAEQICEVTLRSMFAVCGDWERAKVSIEAEVGFILDDGTFDLEEVSKDKAREALDALGKEVYAAAVSLNAIENGDLFPYEFRSLANNQVILEHYAYNSPQLTSVCVVAGERDPKCV